MRLSSASWPRGSLSRPSRVRRPAHASPSCRQWLSCRWSRSRAADRPMPTWGRCSSMEERTRRWTATRDRATAATVDRATGATPARATAPTPARGPWTPADRGLASPRASGRAARTATATRRPARCAATTGRAARSARRPRAAPGSARATRCAIPRRAKPASPGRSCQALKRSVPHPPAD
jgi:hypothetical protein